MAQIKPDVVNPHLFRSTAVAAPLARWHGARVVETYHGREGWRRGLVRGRFLPDRLVSRFVDRVIAVSEAARDFLVSGKGYPIEKITVIPNGADLDAPAPPPGDAPEQYLLYFGAAQSWQGIDTLLRAFARLADFAALRLVFCASRESKSWRNYERLAKKLGVTERIVWKYALDEPELARWRQHALVSVAPLTDCPRNVVQGCAPLKILESMASGTAVVASNVAPVREMIRDRENGWLVHPDRPAELARAIRILLEHPQRARELGANARRTIEERYTWTQSTAALRQTYVELVRKGVPADECDPGLALSQR
jgi:glycosyltransferase involved in cell wall biosynthesis